MMRSVHLYLVLAQVTRAVTNTPFFKKIFIYFYRNIEILFRIEDCKLLHD